MASRDTKGLAQIADKIRTKRAVRRYSQQAVSEEDIRIILNAGRYAQSANNRQPWYFIVAREQNQLRRLAECGRSADQIEGAAFAIALVTAQTGVEDDFDLGQTAAYLQLVAWDLGIGSCIAWVHYTEKTREMLQLPAYLTCRVVLSFGYPASQEQPQPLKESKRKPFDEVVRWEH